MNARYAFLLIPMLAAACSDAPTFSRDAAPARRDAEPFSYGAPVTAQGHLAGADGVQLFYRVYGSGPDTVVVLNGGPGLAISYLDRDLAPLAHGRTVIFYDQRGAGFSQVLYDPSQLTIQKHVADLEAVRQHFGLEKMSIVGHSWGAMVAPWYASEHPERVERLVMVTPGPIQPQYDDQTTANRVARTDAATLAHQNELIGLLLSGTAPDPIATCEELFGSFFPAYMADPAKLQNMRGRWCDGSQAAAANVLFTMFAGRGSLGPSWDLGPMMETVQAPTLVIHAAGDVIPFESTQLYALHLPNDELQVIEGAGHLPWLEQPAEFFTLVNAFLRRGDL